MRDAFRGGPQTREQPAGTAPGCVDTVRYPQYAKKSNAISSMPSCYVPSASFNNTMFHLLQYNRLKALIMFQMSWSHGSTAPHPSHPSTTPPFYVTTVLFSWLLINSRSMVKFWSDSVIAKADISGSESGAWNLFIPKVISDLECFTCSMRMVGWASGVSSIRSLFADLTQNGSWSEWIELDGAMERIREDVRYMHQGGHEREVCNISSWYCFGTLTKLKLSIDLSRNLARDSISGCSWQWH